MVVQKSSPEAVRLNLWVRPCPHRFMDIRILIEDRQINAAIPRAKLHTRLKIEISSSQTKARQKLNSGPVTWKYLFCVGWIGWCEIIQNEAQLRFKRWLERWRSFDEPFTSDRSLGASGPWQMRLSLPVSLGQPEGPSQVIWGDVKTHTTFRALSQRTQSGRVLLLGLKFEIGSENESQPVSGGSSRGGMAPPPASCSASGLSDSCQPQSALVLTVGRHSTSSASPPPGTVPTFQGF